MLDRGGHGASLATASGTAQQPDGNRARPPQTAGRPARAVHPGELSIVFEERGVEHLPGSVIDARRRAPDRGYRGASSPDLAALRRCGAASGAAVSDHDQRSPVNVCVNHYDGGHDFDISHTLRLTFASAGALSSFLDAAHPTLTPWVQHQRRRDVHLCVGGAQMRIDDEQKLELLTVLFEVLAGSDVGRSAGHGPKERPERHGGHAISDGC